MSEGSLVEKRAFYTPPPQFKEEARELFLVLVKTQGTHHSFSLDKTLASDSHAIRDIWKFGVQPGQVENLQSFGGLTKPPPKACWGDWRALCNRRKTQPLLNPAGLKPK